MRTDPNSQNTYLARAHKYFDPPCTWQFLICRIACVAALNAICKVEIIWRLDSPKKAPAASWLAATGLVKSRGGHFHRKKKVPAARCIAAKELVKSRVAIFIEKTAAS